MNFIFKHPLVSLFIFCLLSFFMYLNLMPVSIMEARNFLVTSEMLLDGNWFLTTMNGLPRYEKPPLPAWITSLFVQGNIDNVFWYRLPTSIMSSLGVFLFYFLTKTLTQNKRLSLVSALVLGSSFYYYSIQLEAPSDMFTHVFMLVGILFLIKLFSKKTNFLIYFTISALGIAASILSKGPVSLYALFLPFLLAYIIVYRLKLKQSFYLVGALIAGIAIGGSWYLYVRYADAEAFLEVASRESGNWTSYNVRPFYYYWSFFIQSGIWTIPALLSLFYPYYKNKVYHKKTYLFSWLWTIIAIILLSLIPEKKSRYLVPVLFPLALTTAQFIYYQWKQLKHDKLSRISVYFHYVLLLIICAATLVVPFFLKGHSSTFWIWYVLLAAGGIGIGVFITRHLVHKKFRLLFLGNIFLIFLFTCIGNYGFSFSFNQLNHPPVSEISTVLKDEKVFYFEEIRPEIIWETQTKSTIFSIENPPSLNQFLVIVTESNKPSFLENLPSELIVEKTKTFESSYINNKRNIRNKHNFIHHVYLVSNPKLKN
ncbi:MAG: glycosyltransferase family 39 protein [Psychroflexus maritimus]